MKKLLATIILILFACTAQAQKFKNTRSEMYHLTSSSKGPSIQAGFSVTRSVRGTYGGVDVSLTLLKSLRFGYFNTREDFNLEAPAHKDVGGYMSYQVKINDNFRVGPRLNVVVSDDRFVSLMPMMDARISLNKSLVLATGAGLSDRYPVVNMGLYFKLGL